MRAQITQLGPAHFRFLQSLIWAAIAWSLLQFPIVQRSYIGSPDVEGLSFVVELRRNVVAGNAAPVVFVDFNEQDWLSSQERDARAKRLERAMANESGKTTTGSVANAPERLAQPPIPLHVSRAALAQLLDFLAEPDADADARPAGVFLDIDTSYVTTPEEERLFAAAVERWSKRPDPPLLVLTRTEWSGPSVIERAGMQLADDAPVAFGGAEMIANENFVVDNIGYFSCARDGGVVAAAPIYLAATARYAANGEPHAARKARTTIEQTVRGLNCTQLRSARENRRWFNSDRLDVVAPVPFGPFKFDADSGPINYHFDLDLTEPGVQVSRLSVPLRSGLARRCGAGSRFVATAVPAGMVLRHIDRVEPLDSSLFCGAIVVVGSSYQQIARDNYETPYGFMPGSMIMANAARGMDLAGPLVRFPYLLGLALLTAISLFIFLTFELSRTASAWILNAPAKTVGQRTLRWLAEMLTHALVVGLLTTQVAILVGLCLTWFALDKGYWGVFAAPALAASASNAFDEVNAMRRALLRREPQEV